MPEFFRSISWLNKMGVWTAVGGLITIATFIFSAYSGLNERRYLWRAESILPVHKVTLKYGQCSDTQDNTAICSSSIIGKTVVTSYKTVGGTLPQNLGNEIPLEYWELGYNADKTINPLMHGAGYIAKLTQYDTNLYWMGAKSCGHDEVREINHSSKSDTHSQIYICSCEYFDIFSLKKKFSNEKNICK